MSCKCEKLTKKNNYTYYDTPEGCDIQQKTMVTSRYGAIVGVLFGTYDIIFYSHAVGLVPMLKRYAMHVVPLALMGATFSLVANSVLHMRNKNDHINYFLGGLACGPIAGLYLGNNHAFLLGGLALGVIGMVKKEAVLHNFSLLPQVPRHMGTIRSWRNDFTLRSDPLDDLRHSCGKKE